MITALPFARRDQAVAVLVAAFRNYPVMRYVIGSSSEYEKHLGHLIKFYVDLRYECQWPILGLDSPRELKAVALVNAPTEADWISSDSKALSTLRERLEPDAWARMQAFEEASASVEPAYPHFFLGMLGVRPDQQGKGYAYKLISHISRQSEQDTRSRAVVLTTEDAANHAYYERQGFRMTSSIRIGDLTSSCFIRPTWSGVT